MMALAITPELFALALKDLPISAIHNKRSEIDNSLFHLDRTNLQLQSLLAEDESEEYQSAIAENRVVIERMKHRLSLLETEVLSRRGDLEVPSNRAINSSKALNDLAASHVQGMMDEPIQREISEPTNSLEAPTNRQSSEPPQQESQSIRTKAPLPPTLSDVPGDEKEPGDEKGTYTANAFGENGVDGVDL
ncbi:MAG: hypothetical protein M1829_005831 [Trizodia sp. TS-e1964]|nr:MAG: hypothetical protein M1829_005831 [Trizodia sp. TS-e1964]